MTKLKLIIFLLFLISGSKSFSQGVLISQPRLVAEGNKLIISYDIITQNGTDQFYIWVEMKKSNGETIEAKALSGDIGTYVKAGRSKKITWSPEQDSIYLDDELIVEIKAEKYIKSFNKGTTILKSAILPGWGQASIGKSKPWWIAGIAVYGTLAGGYLYHNKYVKSYESYQAERDPSNRADLLLQTQRDLNISSVMIYTAASAWAANILWVCLTPNRFLPLQHAKLSVNSVPDLYNGGLLFSLRVDF